MKRSGDYNVICDASGFKTKAKFCKRQWNSLFVLRRFWEQKQPQLDIPVVRERLRVPLARPEAQNVYLSPTDMDINVKPF
ncbi:MAG: hypothetical protein ULS35scaffold63_21 [Phage 33_17]|nr:MAG: hypothetical protein ULS35scaffold63_21 [Phage 33_17]